MIIEQARQKKIYRQRQVRNNEACILIDTGLTHQITSQYRTGAITAF
jgi:hypothetical protein